MQSVTHLGLLDPSYIDTVILLNVGKYLAIDRLYHTRRLNFL